MMFWFVHSKSKASPSASRMRRALKMSRRGGGEQARGGRLADAAVLEHVAAGVEVPALRRHRAGAVDDLALDAALAEGREVVARGPGPGRELLMVVHDP